MVTVLASPAKDAVAHTIDANAVRFATGRALIGLLARGPGEAGGAETLAAQALATGGFYHLTAVRQVGWLTGVGTGGVDLHGTVRPTEAIQAKALAKMADAVGGAVARAVGCFEGNHTAVVTFVTGLTGTNTANADTVKVTGACGARACLGLGAIRPFETGEAFALPLHTNTLRGVALLATACLTVLAGSTGLAETLVELANPLAIAFVVLTEPNFS